MFSKQEADKAPKINISRDSLVKWPKICTRNFTKAQTITALAHSMKLLIQTL
jgi:hypothetical protein